MPIDLYYSPLSAPCRAVMLTAAALDLKLNLIKISVMEKDNLKPEFLKLNPQHTIPTLVDEGFCLWESRAIIRYLVNKYGGNSTLYPKDPKVRAVIDQRLDFDFGTLCQRYAKYFYPYYVEGEPFDEKTFDKLQEALGYLNTFLDGNEYVAGPELTIADIILVSSISNMDVTEIDVNKFPNIAMWYDLLRSTLPNYQEANQKGINEMKHLLDEVIARRSK